MGGSGRVGEWQSGRVGEWDSGRVGEWKSVLIDITNNIGRTLIEVKLTGNGRNL